MFLRRSPVGSEEGREEGDLGRVLVAVGDRFAVDEGHPEDFPLLFPIVLDQERGQELGSARHLKCYSGIR